MIVLTMIGKFHQNNEAVSPVLGAILILAISITVIANVQLNFVPVWNAKEDLDHLSRMNDDMRNLKSGIEESAIGGTALSNPVSMGFKYSPKVIVYNPKENAWATLKIEKDVWAEIRYNEVFPEGMDDAVSLKNISTSTITYTLHGASELNSFFYEHGLIRRGRTNFTQSAQTLVSDGAIYALSVNSSGTENVNGIERRQVNVYPVSPPRNSIIGKNVWLTLKTRYPQWWADDPDNPGNLKKRGGEIKLVDKENGTVIVHFDSMVIRMGEAHISTLAAKSPSRSPPSRLFRITPQNVNLPIEGTGVITVDVQDKYNNPVPNIQVNFNMNSSMELPGNANSSATLLQTSAISGADGMASVMLRTGGAGYYYVDASLPSPSFTTTFAYPASSEGYSLSVSYSGSGPNYPVSAALKDGLGNPVNGQTVYFDAGDGPIGLPNNTNSSGIADTFLDTSAASGLSITDIKSSGITDSNAFITWDTVNNIIVTAKAGNVFNYNVIPTRPNSTGCVRYGKTPGNYPYIACDNVTSSSHNVSLTGLSPYNAYYFIVNSSRPAGASVNSSEYMFVTVSDITPPSSITGLNYTSGALYINWTWLDPADPDFDHVRIYIDGVYKSDVTKGVQYYNATFFMPGTAHNLSTPTLDISGNVNPAWENLIASTLSMYSYIFDFMNTAGTIMNPAAAKNDSDGRASAVLTESLIGATSDSHNYTYVTGNIMTNGTITSFTNMRNGNDGGAFANLTEYAGPRNIYKWAFLATQESWTYTTSGGGTMTAGWVSGDGNPLGSIFSRMTAPGGAAQTATITWTSPVFTWTNGTPASAHLDFDWKVQNYTSVNPGTYYVQLVKPGGSVVQIYPTTGYSAASGWSTNSNTSLSTSDFSQSGNYYLNLIAVLNTPAGGGTKTVEVRWDNPAVTLNFYNLNLTMDTIDVPADTDHYLEINYSCDSNDTYNIYVWNGTSWNNRGALASAAWTVFNTSLNDQEYNSGIPRVRYIDANPGGNAQGNLYIDYQRIHGYTPGIPGGYRLDVVANTTYVPDASMQTLQIGYNISAGGDNFTLQVWNGSSWNDRITLNETSYSYRNITLQADEIISSVTWIGNTNSIDMYYVLVRYVDMTASPSQQGRLNLDYQRVYST